MILCLHLTAHLECFYGYSQLHASRRGGLRWCDARTRNDCPRGVRADTASSKAIVFVSSTALLSGELHVATSQNFSVSGVSSVVVKSCWYGRPREPIDCLFSALNRSESLSLEKYILSMMITFIGHLKF